jgi:hypothetical protein
VKLRNLYNYSFTYNNWRLDWWLFWFLTWTKFWLRYFKFNDVVKMLCVLNWDTWNQNWVFKVEYWWFKMANICNLLIRFFMFVLYSYAVVSFVHNNVFIKPQFHSLLHMESIANFISPTKTYDIYFYNTLSRQKEKFVSQKPKKVSFYR